MKRSTAIITAVCFCSMLGGGLAGFLLKPARDFSPQENRYLTQRPALTVSALFSGEWSRRCEDYLQDQFPARDALVVMQAALRRGTGRRDNNGVYFGDALVSTFWQYDRQCLAHNLRSVERFAEKAEIPVYFIPVPDACELQRSKAPGSYPDCDQTALVREMAAAVPSAKTVDLMQRLLAADAAGTKLYYATDHHMTTAGAYQVYAGTAETMGLETAPEPDYEKTTVTTDFRGTLYHKSGAWWTSPDSIERWNLPGVSANLTILPAGTQHESIYNDEALTGTDPYSYFAYGNQPVEVIRTNAEGGKLLLVKDSYAHAVLPFLCAHFSEIHMVDLRYTRESMLRYLRANDIGCAAVLYHISNFAEDTNLALLAAG
jgi:hypothetical protein